MKYFAKYLPVEGEIKVGDKYLREGVGEVYTSGTIDHTHDKKVKLFLCSKDIQVGDITNIGTIYKIYDTRVSTCYEKGCTELLTPKSEVFKVIGEISPEATWVKEGDEFEDNEWQYQQYGASYAELPLVERDVLIKCKCCNTFK